jgi:hypothetical protein
VKAHREPHNSVAAAAVIKGLLLTAYLETNDDWPALHRPMAIAETSKLVCVEERQVCADQPQLTGAVPPTSQFVANLVPAGRAQLWPLAGPKRGVAALCLSAAYMASRNSFTAGYGRRAIVRSAVSP